MSRVRLALVSPLAFSAPACYARAMNDEIPEITIDDDDPRYLRFLEEQAEDRRRWAASPQAKAEMERLYSTPCPDWAPSPKGPPLKYRFVKWHPS